MNWEPIAFTLGGIAVFAMGVYELVQGQTLPRGRFKRVSFTRQQNPIRFWWTVLWELVIGVLVVLYGIFGVEFLSFFGL
jgi:hypothetical protein